MSLLMNQISNALVNLANVSQVMAYDNTSCSCLPKITLQQLRTQMILSLGAL